MGSLTTDFRYAVRMLARRPAVTAWAVVALALGIGLNTTIFGLVDGLLFRPLAVDRPHEVVRVAAIDPERGGPDDLFNVSHPVYTDYRDGVPALASLAAFSQDNPLHLATGAGRAERVVGATVSGSYFPTLGTAPWRGRLIGEDDDRAPGAHPVAVISHGLWRRLFGARDTVVGSAIRLNGHPFTIVGVTPPGFTGVSLESLPDVWVPMAMAAQALPDVAADDDLLGSRRISWLDMVGRLAAGATIADAQAQIDALARARAERQPAADRDHFARILPAEDLVLDPAARTRAAQVAWLLLGVVALVLFIACADAAGLLLVRADERRRELAVRAAMGASRSRIARQLLIESLVLAVLSAAAGLLLASWSADALALLVPDDFPVVPAPFGLLAEPRVLAFTLVVTVLAGLLFGLAPAWAASRPDLMPALKQEARHAGRPRRLSLRNVMVVAEVAVAVPLLMAAGLLLRTLWNVAAVSPGFDRGPALVASFDLARQGYSPEGGAAFVRNLRERLAAAPGVTAVALGRMVPVQSSGMRVTFEPSGYRPGPDEFPVGDFNPVAPGFLRAMGVPVLRGREFTEADTADAPPVALINKALADAYFAGRDPIGQRLGDLGPTGRAAEIVGVVGDTRYRSMRVPAAPMVYVPHAQFFMPRMTLVVRTTMPPLALRSTVADAVGALDPDLPLFQVMTMDERLRASLAQERLLAWLLGIFAGLALFLAVAGLYGVVAYGAALRTREFGIRIALGAQAAHVRRLVLAQGLALTAVGLALGLILTLPAGAAIRALLFEVPPRDPPTTAAVVVLLAAAAALAGQWPARRAARIEPSTALREH